MSASSSEPSAAPAPGTGQIDLNAASASGNLVISAETREDPADQQHRHELERAQARQERWKDGVRFLLSSALVAGIAGVALYLMLSPRFTADEKGWARTVLAGIVSALAGYFIGKNAGG